MTVEGLAHDAAMSRSTFFDRFRREVGMAPMEYATSWRMALAKELTQLSLPDIGEAFGGRDHTTVLHACRKIADLRSANSDITRDVNSLLKVLRS